MVSWETESMSLGKLLCEGTRMLLDTTVKGELRHTGKGFVLAHAYTNIKP